MTSDDDLSPAEQLECHALEVGLLIREVVEQAEEDGFPADAITAALLASAIIHRRRTHGAARVVPWLEGAADANRSVGNTAGSIAQH